MQSFDLLLLKVHLQACKCLICCSSVVFKLKFLRVYTCFFSKIYLTRRLRCCYAKTNTYLTHQHHPSLHAGFYALNLNLALYTQTGLLTVQLQSVYAKTFLHAKKLQILANFILEESDSKKRSSIRVFEDRKNHSISKRCFRYNANS